MRAIIALAAIQTIATTSFRIFATLISAFTVWQGPRAWRRVYEQHSGEWTAESDIQTGDDILHG